MRAASKQIHASSHPKLNWSSINWKQVKKKVQELQMRIAKAVREGKFRLVKSLQWLLTHSFYGRLWAIRRVVTNEKIWGQISCYPVKELSKRHCFQNQKDHQIPSWKHNRGDATSAQPGDARMGQLPPPRVLQENL